MINYSKLFILPANGERTLTNTKFNIIYIYISDAQSFKIFSLVKTYFV